MSSDERGMSQRGTEGPSDEELDRAIPGGSEGRELRVGAFVLVGILASLLVLFLTTDPATFRGRYLVTATVDDAGGVRNGDPVQMRGVNIGRVDGFDIMDGQVLMRLEIEGEWEIPSDSRVRIAGTGLIGGRTVEVVPGDAGDALPPGGTLPGSSSEDIMGTVRDLGGQATTALERIEALLSEPTVSAVQGSARDLESLLGELAEITREQKDDVAELTASLNRTAAGLESAAEAGPEAARAIARADSALARLHATSATLERATASMETVLVRIEEGEGTLGKLSRDDSLYVNLNRAAESLDRLLVDLRENPGRYIKLQIF